MQGSNWQIFGLCVSTLLLTLLMVSTTFAAPTAAAGDIIINEIMQNPDVVDDADGEWFEIVNVTGNAIDINGWEIRDDDFDNHIIVNGGPLLVNPGDYFVLCKNDDFNLNGGVNCDYSFGGDIFIGNGVDELVLVQDPLGTPLEIARVEYDDGAVWPDPTGASMEFSVPDGQTAEVANNNGANWETGVMTFGDGDIGTPGAQNFDWNPTAVTFQHMDSNVSDDVQTLRLLLVMTSLLVVSVGALRIRHQPR